MISGLRTSQSKNLYGKNSKRISICLCAVFLWLGCARPCFAILISSNSHPIKLRPTIESFLVENNIASLEDYIVWLQKNIHYKSDMHGDQWAVPEETLKRYGGDCEDLAFLSAAVVEHFGYQPHVLAYAKNPKEAHAFCIFKRNGRINIFDNTRFVETKARSVLDLAAFGFKQEHALALLELNLAAQKITVLYENPALFQSFLASVKNSSFTTGLVK